MPDRDLMERVELADPMPDADRLSPDDQHEADDLLARIIANPPPATAQEGRGPRLRRLALAGAGLACAALVALAAVDLLGSDDDPDGGGVIDRAIAAVSAQDAVYHVVQLLRADDSARQEVVMESWHTTDGRLHRKVFTARDGRRGRLLEEFAGRRRPGRTSGPALRYDATQDLIHESGFGIAPGGRESPSLDPFGDPSARLKSLQEEGELKLAGTTEVDGRRGYRLVSELTGRGRDRYEYVVDAETYLPLAQRYSAQFGAGGGRIGFSGRFLVYKKLPLDSRADELLAMDPHPGATCSPGAGELRGDRSVGFPNPCQTKP